MVGSTRISALEYIYIIILQKYTTVWNFSRFGNQPSWVTAAAVRYGGLQRNRRGPRRQGGQRSAAGSGGRCSLPPWVTAVRDAPAVGHGSSSYRHGGRRQPHLYKGRRRPPPPPTPVAASSPTDAPSSPPVMFSLSFSSHEVAGSTAAVETPHDWWC
jgi:hypothetical protein